MPREQATVDNMPTGFAGERTSAGATLRRFLLLPLLLVVAILAITSLLGDSITFDETSHLTSGLSYWKTGDYRFAPDHPPLGKLWAALPLLLVDHQWPEGGGSGYEVGDVFGFGKTWLFRLNEGERLLVYGRLMMVVLLVATVLATWGIARRLLGGGAALLALWLAAFSPTLLAHGRLVTTDIPLALGVALTLLAFAGLHESLTWRRVLLAGLALGLTALTKFSWVLLLPALLAMSLWSLARSAPLRSRLLKRGEASDRTANDAVEEGARGARGDSGGTAGGGRSASALTARSFRVGHLALAWLVLLLITWGVIWVGYGFRYSLLGGGERLEEVAEGGGADARVAKILADEWGRMLGEFRGGGLDGLQSRAIEIARAYRLLPEAYLYGYTFTVSSTRQRSAYLLGYYSNDGWRAYFPIAFLIKTPIPTLALLIVGATTLLSRRVRVRDAVLLVGVLTFVVLYAGVAVFSTFNIGHRHLLPLYPLLIALAAASVTWWTHHYGRWLIVAAVAWLVAANVWVHPHYLPYFNEFTGGPRYGHLWLADSNIDWGQDIKRLADFAAARPHETIKLAYFGSGDPSTYGFRCRALPSTYAFGEPAALTPGLYVVSVNQLLGVYDHEVRDAFWSEQVLEAYAALGRIAVQPLEDDLPGAQREQIAQARVEFADLQKKRLLNQLQKIPPTTRIGYSLFVYELGPDALQALTSP